MILNFLDEVDGGDTQKKQLVNPHVELRKQEIKYCWFGLGTGTVIEKLLFKASSFVLDKYPVSWNEY